MEGIVPGLIVEVTLSRSVLRATYNKEGDLKSQELIYINEEPRKAKVLEQHSWGEYGNEWVVIFENDPYQRKRYVRKSEITFIA